MRPATQFLKTHSATLRDSIIIVFLAFPTFFRLGLPGTIRPADSEFPIDPSNYLHHLSFTWYDKGWLFGNDGSFTSIAQLPFYFLPVALQWVGLSTDLVNRGTLTILLSLLGASAYLAARHLLPLGGRSGPLVGATFYMYNPYMTGELYLGHWFTFYAYAALPMMVVGVARGIRGGSRWRTWALLTGASSIFLAHRVRLLPIAIEFVCLYAIFSMAKDRSWNSLTRTVRFFAVAIIGAALANASWIAPSLERFSSVYTLLTHSTANVGSQFLNSPTFSDPLNVIRLVGYGIPTWHPTGLFYEVGLGAFTGLVIPIIAFGSLLFGRRNKTLQFFALTALAYTLGILILSQSSDVLSSYRILQSAAPTPLNLLQFPSSFEFWTVPVVLSLVYMLGYLTEAVEARLGAALGQKRPVDKGHLNPAWVAASTSRVRLRPIMRGVIPIALVIIILLNSAPLIAGVPGDFMAPVVIPSYYSDASHWLASQPQDFVILPFPRPTALQYVKYTWAFQGLYSMTDVFPQVAPGLFVSANLPLGTREGVEVVDLLYHSLSSPTISDLLSLMSVKYVVHRNDVVSPENASFIPPYGFPLENSLGKLNFYRNPNYTPILSSSQTILPVWGTDKALLPLLSSNLFPKGSTAFVFFQDNSNGAFVSLLDRTPILIDFDSPINDTAILTHLAAGKNRLLYLISDSESASVRILRDELAVEMSAYSNGTSISRAMNLQRDSIVTLQRSETNIPSNATSVYGTSVATDVATANDSSTSQFQVNWQADSNSVGFHALYLNLNQSLWGLDQLASFSGGLALDVYGDGSGRELRFSFMGPQSQYFFWPLQSLYLNWTGWKRLYLPLSHFQMSGTPTWSSVQALWIWQEIPSKGKSGIQITIKDLSKEIAPEFSIFYPPDVRTLFDYVSAPSLSWVEQSPVSYRVTLKATTPTLLRLGVSFDDGWVAVEGGSKLEHFRIDTYSNGFYVIPSNQTVQVSIVYDGQTSLALGEITSVSFFIALGLFLLVPKPIKLEVRRRLSKLFVWSKRDFRQREGALGGLNGEKESETNPEKST